MDVKTAWVIAGIIIRELSVSILRLDRIAEGRLEPAGFFDVYPADDAPEFNGAWSAYP